MKSIQLIRHMVHEHIFHFDLLFTGLSVAAIIAALTIGGKAIGKSFAVNNSNEILYNFAKFVSYFNNG